MFRVIRERLKTSRNLECQQDSSLRFKAKSGDDSKGQQNNQIKMATVTVVNFQRIRQQNMYLEPCQRSLLELFAAKIVKIVHS